MKFYRLLLLSIVCIMAFVSGWFLRGVYFSDQNHGLNSSLIRRSECRETFKKRDAFKKATVKDQDSGYQPLANSETIDPLTGEIRQKIDSLNKAEQDHPKALRSKKLIKKQKSYDVSNKKYILSIPNNSTFLIKGTYSFLINVFSKEDEAAEYIKTLRKNYPLWNFFLKVYEGGFKVYIGPFEDQTRAHNFIDSIPKKSFPFNSYFLEKQTL